MSQIRISREHFLHNISQIAAKTQSVERIALVLKDNAYGHGLEVMAQLAVEAGIRHAVVRRVAEARRIGSLFSTVLILSEIPQTPLPDSFRIAVNEEAAIGRIPEGTAVELKIDTGMHRHGIDPVAFSRVVEAIASRGLRLVGVMTHYRSADEIGSDLFWQRKRFEAIREEAERMGLSGLRWHSCNSAALFRTASFDEDIARIGIAAYGCLRMPSVFDPPKLEPVMSLWADRIATRTLVAGARVGYGGEGFVTAPTSVSSYDIGYGDGWFRGDTRTPYRLPDGRALLGRVSMDAVSLEGEEERICLFDDAAEAASQLGTIPYEVTTRLDPGIERVVV
ncbi:alanine racemase [Hydrogenimonas sp.]